MMGSLKQKPQRKLYPELCWKLKVADSYINNDEIVKVVKMKVFKDVWGIYGICNHG